MSVFCWFCLFLQAVCTYCFMIPFSFVPFSTVQSVTGGDLRLSRLDRLDREREDGQLDVNVQAPNSLLVKSDHETVICL